MATFPGDADKVIELFMSNAHLKKFDINKGYINNNDLEKCTAINLHLNEISSSLYMYDC